MRKINQFLLSCLIAAACLSANCYDDWLTAYDGATLSYQHDLEYCGGPVWDRGKCLDEAELSYNQALSSASSAYYDCVGFP